MSGIFGFIGKGNAFVEVRTGLENLSHRGQESWGIVSGLKDGSFSEVRRIGSIFQAPPLSRLHAGSADYGLGIALTGFSCRRITDLADSDRAGV